VRCTENDGEKWVSTLALSLIFYLFYFIFSFLFWIIVLCCFFFIICSFLFLLCNYNFFVSIYEIVLNFLAFLESRLKLFQYFLSILLMHQ